MNVWLVITDEGTPRGIYAEAAPALRWVEQQHDEETINMIAELWSAPKPCVLYWSPGPIGKTGRIYYHLFMRDAAGDPYNLQWRVSEEEVRGLLI